MSTKKNFDKLILAVPSKGRLQENATNFFKNAGLTLAQPGGARDYRGIVKGVPDIEVAYLSASEIARELSAGNVHIGVTGLDLVHETIANPDKEVSIVTPLGFGYADVVVAVPQSWIDVRTMDDLEDVAAGFRTHNGRRMRVATKYIALTRRFFASHGIADYRIVESLGATEGAPASGAAELIVDITTTGTTLAANDLKILSDGVILKSEANLVASQQARWSKKAVAALSIMLERIAAHARAKDVVEIRATVGDPARLGRQAMEKFNVRLPFGAVGGTGPITMHCPRETMWECTSWLKEKGADTITVSKLDYVLEAKTPSFDELLKSLS
jgi:ATP phosphoribosyltransferase